MRFRPQLADITGLAGFWRSGFWVQMSGQNEIFKSVRILTEKLKMSGFYRKG